MMRPAFLILLIMSLIVAGMGKTVANSFPQIEYLNHLFMAISCCLLISWVVIERKGLKVILGRKGLKYGASSGLTVVLAIAIFIGLAVLTNKPRFDKSIDLTTNQVNTLSDHSIKVVDQFRKDTGE